MAQLYFRYGAMGSSKTANALMVRYNYIERGKTVLMLKPRTDTRDGENIIKSRIGLQCECEIIDDYIIKESYIVTNKAVDVDVVIVDEAQFLSNHQVDWLSNLVDFNHIPVICYGLRTDFQGKLFEGSKRLLEVADKIEEIKTICWCGRKATFNARLVNGQITTDGETIQLGGNESYISLCRRHYKLKQIGGE